MKGMKIQMDHRVWAMLMAMSICQLLV